MVKCVISPIRVLVGTTVQSVVELREDAIHFLMVMISSTAQVVWYRGMERTSNACNLTEDAGKTDVSITHFAVSLHSSSL